MNSTHPIPFNQLNEKAGPCIAVMGWLLLLLFIASAPSARADNQTQPTPVPSIAGTGVPTTAPATLPSNQLNLSAAKTQPAIIRPDLLSYGNGDFLWVAHVGSSQDSSTSENTTILMRTAGADRWQPMPEISSARVVDMASLGGQLAVLLNDGNWLLASSDGNSLGTPLPDKNARILAFASSGDLFMALASGASPITRPALPTTLPATLPATTEAATQPGAPGDPLVTLYSRKGTDWTPLDGPTLPADVAPDMRVSLALIDRVPYLAVERHDGAIDVIRQGGTGWEQLAHVPPRSQAGPFKLLAGFTPPSLWLAGQPADELVVIPPGSEMRRISLSELPSPLANRTSVYCINAIRDLGLASDGKLIEHDYGNKFEPLAISPPSVLPGPAGTPLPSPLYTIALAIVLVFAIYSSARRRRDTDEANPEMENLVLADLGRRMVAGLIDGAPFLAPLILLPQVIHDMSKGADPFSQSSVAMVFWLVFFAALAVYLIHSAASETLTGRTLGKLIMGLRVVNLDGSTPDASSLLIRNFLRIIDIGLLGMTLAFILFSPLRQRIGDVAAGTVVIRDRVKPEGNLIDPVKTPVESPPAEG